MPWSNNSGGGGWKGGGGGPWGQGPQQRGPQTPDLEELLRRSQDRLRNVLPSGGRGNISIAVLIAAALVVFWVVKCVYTVQPDELGQELVFGKPKEEVATAGLHFHLLADRDRREGFHPRAARIHRRRHGAPRGRREQSDAVRRPEHRGDQLHRAVAGRRSEAVPLQRRRAGGVSAARGRQRHARAGGPLHRRGGSHRAPRRGRGGRARAAAGHARRLQRRHICRRHPARTRRPADGSGRRFRGGATGAAGSQPLSARSRPIRQSPAWRCARRGGADHRGGAWIQGTGRGGSGGRVAALHLGPDRIRGRRGCDAQASVPRDDGTRLAGRQQDHPRRIGFLWDGPLSAARRVAAKSARGRPYACPGAGRRCHQRAAAPQGQEANQ